MADPIRTHAIDPDDDAVRERHVSIERRLEALGADQVRLLLATGGLPTEWNPIIHAWLAGTRIGTA